LLSAADFDFQVFEFVGINDDAHFKRMMTHAQVASSSKEEVETPIMTVDASQLVVSNRKSLDSLHSLQVNHFAMKQCLNIQI
jgi:hypothetical protein